MDKRIKLFLRNEKIKLRDVRAIVVHWDGGKVSEIDALWKWMEDRETSYHYLVSENTVLQTRDTELRAIHCGHKTYTRNAINFFGAKVCSAINSPNNYTLGVCMLHDSPGGAYYTSTMNTAVELIANLCVEFEIDPTKQLLRHSDITSEKSIPCPQGFYVDEELWCYFKCKICLEIGRIDSLWQM